jgi:protein O-GlcNAc transferase
MVHALGIAGYKNQHARQPRRHDLFLRMTSDPFRAAVRAHQAGRLADAEALYRRVTEQDPLHSDAYNLLGVLHHQTGRSEAAIELARRAIALSPLTAVYHANLALIFAETGRSAEALAAFDDAIRRDAQRKEAHNGRGAVLDQLGRSTEALAAFDQALALDPNYAEAHLNQGVALANMGRLADAADALRRAAALRPDHPDAYYNLGNCLVRLERLEEAVAAYHQAIERHPGFAEAHVSLGEAFGKLKHFDEALESFDRALRIRPGWANALDRRGLALYEAGRPRDAETALRAALSADPKHAAAHFNLANVLRDDFRFDEADALYGRALELAPPNHDAVANRLALWLYDPRLSPSDIYERTRATVSRFERLAAPYPEISLPEPARRLRIGWLSSDFRHHPVGRNLLAIVPHLDTKELQHIFYSDTEAEDELTRDLQLHAAAWRATRGMSDDALVQQMRDDRIDILILLAGRFDKNRVLFAAQRACPIQVSYHDPATSGLLAMDYLISDRYLTPRTAVAAFTERPLRLPSFYIQTAPEASPPVAAPQRQEVVFGCFNNPMKINDAVMALWGRLLQEVPGSRLRLQYFGAYSSADTRNRILAGLGRAGVASHRAVFGNDAQKKTDHLAGYTDIDMALDTFPFSGSTTTFEALWMGVPVITRPGATMASRWSASMMNTLGLDDFIAFSDDDYITIARHWAARPAERAALRHALRQRVERSPLCNGKARARQIERLLRAIWRRHSKRTE